MRTGQEITNLIYAWITPATDCWYKDQCRNPSKAFYAYYKPSTKENDGAIVIAESPLNEDWKLVSPERISGFKTKEQVKANLFELARRLPILRTE